MIFAARALVVLGAVLLVSCASTSPAPPVRGIHPAIDKWQDQVGVEIGSSAQKTLLTDLQHQIKRIMEEDYRLPGAAPAEQFSVVLGGAMGNVDGRSVAGDSLINTLRIDEILELYLFELRNRLATAKGIQPVVIRWRDLQRFDFGYFVEVLAHSRGECGWILVRSNPSGADIFLKGKNKGITLNKFVGPPGVYELQVSHPMHKLSCRRTVTVHAGQTEVVDCPERKR